MSSSRRLSGFVATAASAVAPLLALALAAASLSCARVAPLPMSGAGGGGGAGNGAGGSNRFDGGVRPDAPTPVDLGCTSHVSCTPAGGQYCGIIGDGCQSTIDCGTCPGDQICAKGLCIGGLSCVATTSCAPASGGSNYCGDIGNGCGGKVSCGDCATGGSCNGGLCVAANCVPLTCNIASGGGKYCGMIGDGCGGTLNCSCDAPQTCGGTGIDHVCGDPSCVPITCNPPGGGQYCGDIGNGCGKALACPAACANGVACPADHVCPSMGPGVCTNLQCNVDKCTAGGNTTISGTVYDPAGTNPLYNVVVYVPNQPLDPIQSGATCDTCASPVSGQPVAAALTDATGHFVMKSAPSPAGKMIPIVVQIGKWRRQIMIGPINPCVDNPVPDKTLRLPRSQSEGNLPKIAFSTGHSDSLDCLMRQIGIADSEFTPDSGNGRVHMYVGLDAGNGTGPASLASGGAFASSYNTLFNNYAKLSGYDILMLNCEGGSPSPLPAASSFENIRKYADNGGRIFDEHVHAYWIQKGLPPWPSVAVWDNSAVAVTATASIDTTFPKGMALSTWLGSVGALTGGQISLTAVEHSVDAVIAPTQRWIYTADGHTQYMTFNTPLEAPAAAQCGRVVFTDLHVGSGSGAPNLPAGNKPPFPTDCSPSTTPMTPQQKALEFTFFDLSSCVQVDTTTPQTPPIPPLGGTTPPPNVVPQPPAPPPPPPPPPPPSIP